MSPTRMRAHLRAPVAAACLAAAGAAQLGCRPDLGEPRLDCAARGAADAGPPEVWIEPEAPLDQAPAVLRVHLRVPGAAGTIDPERLALVRGPLGPAQLGQIARAEISAALSERIVPALIWQDKASPGHVVLAPSVPLAPGELYSVGSGEPRFAATLETLADDPLPLLGRVWPPLEASASPTVAVWCGTAQLPALASPAQLAPSGPVGLLATGAFADGFPRACLRFEPAALPAEPPAEGPFVPPPLLVDEAGSAIGRLDPRPLSADEPAVETAALGCAPDEVGFGPGCALVQDDRLVARTPDAALFWSVRLAGAAAGGGELDLARGTGPGEPLLVFPLPADSEIELVVQSLDAAGRAGRGQVAAHTLPPMPHVVLSEVLANPNGPEPAQEWVELYNDGLAHALLAGYVLGDAGGETALPAAVLPPGAYALLVGESYDPASDLDPAPAPGTLLLRVPKVGKNGLSNDGEPLVLRDEAGHAVSRFPAKPKPKPGVSVVRTSPKAPDEVDGSFVLAPEGPTPGAPNAAEQAD
ncbi:MAG: lamin tail domain-containing protein [Deltaproteobacteria bacterium]|nr:lamin tail domain-containing protein [Deltaproteobacteria bacterium]